MGLIGRKFAKDAMIYFIATALNAALPIVLLPVLTRVLTPADYGIVSMFAIVLTLFGAFTGLSLHGAVSVRFFHLGEEVIGDFVSSCLILLLGLTCGFALLVTFFGHWIEVATGVPHDWLIVAAFVSGAQILGQVRLVLWQVRQQAIRYATFQTGQALSNLALSLYLVLAVGMAWQGRVLGQTVVFSAFALGALFWLWTSGFIRFPKDFRSHIRYALAFGVPLIPHVIGALMIAAIDRFIIVNELGLAAAGVYMVGAQIGLGLGMLTDAFNKVYSPWLMRRLTDEGAASYSAIIKLTWLYLLAVILIALALGALSPFIIGLLAGPDFQDARDTVIYVALGYAFRGGYLMISNFIFYVSRTEMLAAVTLFCGAINVGLAYLLVQQHGIVGAAQAFAITQILFCLSTWLLANRVYPMPWLRLMWSSDTKD